MVGVRYGLRDHWCTFGISEAKSAGLRMVAQRVELSVGNLLATARESRMYAGQTELHNLSYSGPSCGCRCGFCGK